MINQTDKLYACLSKMSKKVKSRVRYTTESHQTSWIQKVNGKRILNVRMIPTLF